MKKYDVAVIGSGITGCILSYLLATGEGLPAGEITAVRQASQIKASPHQVFDCPVFIPVPKK